MILNSSPAEALKTFIINIIFIFTGFTGTLCELLDPNSVCYNNPCQNQGTCRNTISLRAKVALNTKQQKRNNFLELAIIDNDSKIYGTLF
jgi:hypothetical protein